MVNRRQILYEIYKDRRPAHKEHDMTAPVLYWLRQDLRLGDNPALSAALATGQPVIPVFILDDAAAGPWTYGGASRWWLHHSLTALTKDLSDGPKLQLILRQGDSREILDRIIKQTGATSLFWNRRYEPWAIAQDKDIKQHFTAKDVAVESFNARLLAEPWTIRTQQDTPYRVFTPFWRSVSAKLQKEPPPLLAKPRKQSTTPSLASDNLDDWHLLPTKPDWAAGLRAMWTPGEASAQKALKKFIAHHAGDYTDTRNLPGIAGTSSLSPHLAFGEISPRQIWHATQKALHDGSITPSKHAQAETFLSEIGWREFAYHLLYHYPHTVDTALNEKYRAFPWRHSEKDLRAWQQGQTGYPLVDAGMRQLWQTGWMHNRVRMVVGSVLVKQLLLPWQDGAAWFWDTLVDADLAANTMNWQWVAGCGADAAPYFRVFNPATQAKKFDPDGAYIRRFVPELKNTDNKTLQQEKIDGYIKPLVELAKGRTRALEALATLKG